MKEEYDKKIADKNPYSSVDFAQAKVHYTQSSIPFHPPFVDNAC